MAIANRVKTVSRRHSRRHGVFVVDQRPERITRLRSRHRLFTQQRADRSRLQGSLVLDVLLVIAAAIWWLTGHWQVAVAWAGAALISAGFSLRAHRRGAASGELEERWRLRGFPGPGSVMSILGVAVVFLMTARFGFGWTWGDASFIPTTSALAGLFVAWRDARRYRAFVAQRRPG